MAERSDVEAAIGVFAVALKQLGICVQQIFLFGSHARGVAIEDSDIDLLVVSPSFSGMPHWRRWELLGKAIAQVRKPLEVLGYAPEEFERLQNTEASFVRHILLQPETVEVPLQ